jgi:phage shock protein PspC (stress-responsive transcriptional regulator)
MPENPPHDPDENPVEAEGAATPPPPPPPPEPEPAPRRLTRSTSDRLIGGVAGGLGRYFGVDPILFRIAFVVLTFAGGIGLLAYVGLLAFVPAEDGRTVTQGRDANAIGAVLLVILAVIVLSPPVFFLGPVLLPAALLIGIGLLLWRAAGGSRPTGGDPARVVARGAVALLIGIAAVGGFVGVFLLAAMGGGTALAILAISAGVALVVTAFAGGARWLIVPALLLVLPLAIVAAADIDIEGGVGDRSYRPSSAGELRPDYGLGMGELLIDLRNVELPAGRTDMRVDVGVGHAVVRVPDDVCVTSDVEIGIGQASVLDHGSGGVDVAFAETGAASAGTPELHVDADIGIGALHVRRGTDPLFDRGFLDDEVACP